MVQSSMEQLLSHLFLGDQTGWEVPAANASRFKLKEQLLFLKLLMIAQVTLIHSAIMLLILILLHQDLIILEQVLQTIVQIFFQGILQCMLLKLVLTGQIVVATVEPSMTQLSDKDAKISFHLTGTTQESTMKKSPAHQSFLCLHHACLNPTRYGEVVIAESAQFQMLKNLFFCSFKIHEHNYLVYLVTKEISNINLYF